MKYEFKKNDVDEYSLIYTNKDGQEKKIDFKRTIEMASSLQGMTAKARIEMFKTLSKEGLTKDDLIIKRDLGNGKVTYDETNYRLLEQEFIEEQSMKIANDIMEKCFKMNILDLFKEMGIEINENEQITVEEQQQITLFTQKFMTIIKGNEDTTPSSPNKEQE